MRVPITCNVLPYSCGASHLKIVGISMPSVTGRASVFPPRALSDLLSSGTECALERCNCAGESGFDEDAADERGWSEQGERLELPTSLCNCGREGRDWRASDALQIYRPLDSRATHRLPDPRMGAVSVERTARRRWGISAILSTGVYFAWIDDRRTIFACTNYLQ